jgi:peptidyl-prolyl cis-trans isomerase C
LKLRLVYNPNGRVFPTQKEQAMPRARARHILVPTAAQAEDLKAQIAAGADFADLAAAHSSCPSGARGGDLGEFLPGQMVREFNDVCFNDEVGVVHGPVKTQFGYHLIEVTSRTE